MSVVDQTTQYIIIIYASLLFSVLAFLEDELNGKSVILQYFAGLLWLISGFTQFVIGDVSNILGLGLSYLFIGFAFTFFIAGFYNTFGLIKTRRKTTI